MNDREMLLDVYPDKFGMDTVGYGEPEEGSILITRLNLSLDWIYQKMSQKDEPVRCQTHRKLPIEHSFPALQLWNPYVRVLSIFSVSYTL